MADSQYRFNNDYVDSFGANNLTEGGTGNTFDTTTKIAGASSLRLIGSGDARYTDLVNGFTSGNSNRTVTCWIYPRSSFNGQTILSLGTSSSNQEFTIQLDNLSSTHRILVKMNGNDVAINLLSKLSLNTWYFLAVTYTASTKTSTARINATTQGSAVHANNSNLTFPNSNGLVIGDRISLDHTAAFIGNLDDGRIYNSLLTTPQLDVIYSSGGGFESNAVSTFSLPTSQSSTNFILPSNTLLDDGNYGSLNVSDTSDIVWQGYDLSVATDVRGIEIEMVCKSRNDGLVGAGIVDLSWDGGSHYTESVSYRISFNTSNGLKQRIILGSPTDLWGRTWSITELTPVNFRVRLNGDPTVATTQLDVDVPYARVYYQQPTTTSTSSSTSTTTTSTSSSTTSSTSSSTSTTTTSTSSSTSTTTSTSSSTSTTTTSTSTTTTSTSTTTTSTSTTTTSTSTSTTSSTSTSTTVTMPLNLAVNHGD